MLEEFCRDALRPYHRLGDKKQAPFGPFPAGYVSTLCRAEDVLPFKLALLPCNVFESPKKQGSTVFSSRFR